MLIDANAILHSWTLLAAFSGLYAPGVTHEVLCNTHLGVYYLDFSIDLSHACSRSFSV